MGIIVLSMHDDELYAERALNCTALSYINNQESAQKLLLGIKQVMKNKIFVKAELLEKTCKNPSRTITSKNAVNIQILTDRELQFFEAIGQGITTYSALRINIITLQRHNHHDSRETELICFVYSNNLTHYMWRFYVILGAKIFIMKSEH
ncbi:hypothetical protein H4J46_02135 [Colwellia sp. MB02u-6]|uniref:hypothetical protein n=1 Tax=Colwellia sp. MB02u-6 TaxID=2759824 RepID=UPI0015F49D7C|nr:hypothetical protein [Colwellia sp. MB02u-6]MBA6326752.1 hypothetical protein [Colwellia sp. MB02u-6]